MASSPRSDPARVVVVSHTADVGGAEIALLRLLRARDRAAFDVSAIVLEEGAFPELLRAARMLRRDDLEIVIVGSQGFDAGASLSAYEQELRSLAADLAGDVTFLPFVDRDALPQLLQSADVFVAPSRWPEPR